MHTQGEQPQGPDGPQGGTPARSRRCPTGPSPRPQGVTGPHRWPTGNPRQIGRPRAFYPRGAPPLLPGPPRPEEGPSGPGRPPSLLPALRGLVPPRHPPFWRHPVDRPPEEGQGVGGTPPPGGAPHDAQGRGARWDSGLGAPRSNRFQILQKTSLAPDSRAGCWPRSGWSGSGRRLPRGGRGPRLSRPPRWCREATRPSAGRGSLQGSTTQAAPSVPSR